MENSNKVIAEFMGHIIDYGFKKDAILYMPQGEGNASNNAVHLKLDKVKYHKSWDWLMPVIQRCYDEGERLDGTEHNFIGEITESLLDGDIEASHKAVVEIIKWYNENK